MRERAAILPRDTTCSSKVAAHPWAVCFESGLGDGVCPTLPGTPLLPVVMPCREEIHAFFVHHVDETVLTVYPAGPAA